MHIHCICVYFSAFVKVYNMHCFRAQRFGVTTSIPDKVPQWLPVIETSHDAWNYDGRSLYHNGSETEFPDLAYLHDLFTGQSVGLLITTRGDLYLYFSGCHAKHIAAGLPVDKPLWGAVDALSSCTGVESEILSGGDLDGVYCLCSRCIILLHCSICVTNIHLHALFEWVM